jgi:dipicolinate synthase subunit A
MKLHILEYPSKARLHNMLYKTFTRSRVPMDGIILKDDARYHHTEAYLQSRGHNFHGIDTNPCELDFAIFPFKEKVSETTFDDEYFAAFKKNAQIFSGIRSDYLSEKCTNHKLSYHVMMEDAGTAVRNAVPTSEGVIAYLIQNLQRTIASSRILVIGYGVCGRDLASRLSALGAEVSAVVRSREKECAAKANSVTPIYLDGNTQLDFDAIVNTVPAQVLTNEAIAAAKALLVDIASAPHGFDMAFAKTQNNRSALLPGIPGKHAVKTAGEILGEFIAFILGDD